MTLLVLTHSSDATADFLCDRLRAESVQFLRFDSDVDLREVEVSFDEHGPSLDYRSVRLAATDVTHLWFRRPEPLSCAWAKDDAEHAYVQAEWSEAVEGFLSHIDVARWMNHPAFNVIASHKMEQISRARQFGLRVPATMVTQRPHRVREFWAECNGDVIVKPLSAGFLERPDPKDDTLIYTNSLAPSDLESLDNLSRCPTLFQRRVRKKIDVRVCMVDEDVIAAALLATDDGEQRLDIRRNNMADLEYRSMHLPDELQHSLRRLTQSYGLRFAAIDLALDADGNWMFFEINPNGQWAWLDQSGVFDIAASFVKAFCKP